MRVGRRRGDTKRDWLRGSGLAEATSRTASYLSHERLAPVARRWLTSKIVIRLDHQSLPYECEIEDPEEHPDVHGTNSSHLVATEARARQVVPMAPGRIPGHGRHPVVVAAGTAEPRPA